MNISKERLLEIEAELSTLTISKISRGENIRIAHAHTERYMESYIAEMIHKVKEAVSKCSSRNDLESNYRWAYRWICKNKRKDLIEHLIIKKVRTQSEVKKVFDNWKGAKKQFTNTHRAEASWAIRNGLWVEWTKGFVNPRVKNK